VAEVGPVRPPVALSSARGSKQRDRTILVVDDHVAFAEALASVVDDVPGCTRSPRRRLSRRSGQSRNLT